MFKQHILLIILITALTAGNSSANDDNLPAAVLSQVEGSVGGLDFANRLQINLELARYYDVFKNPEKADRYYERIISTLWDAKPKEIADNANYVERLLNQLEKVERPLKPDGTKRGNQPNLPDLISQYRSLIIQKTLNESDDKSVQNGDMRAMGAESASKIAEQLALAPEFKGLFRIAVDSFQTTRNASVSHAQNLTELIAAQYREDAGPPPKEGEVPCDDKERILFDEDTIKNFTCAGATIAAGESDLASKEDYDLIQTYLCEAPFKDVVASCAVRFHVRARKIAIEKAKLEEIKKLVPEKCEIPRSLQSYAEENKEPEDHQTLPQLTAEEGSDIKPETCEEMDDTLFFAAIPQGRSLRCADYIRELKMEKGKDAQTALWEKVELCKDSKDAGGCFEKWDKAAADLNDFYRFPTMLEITRASLEKLSFEQAKSLESRLIDQLNHYSELDPNPGIKNVLLNQVDDSLTKCLDKAWESPKSEDKLQGFTDVLHWAQSIADPAIRERLSIHVLEKISELGNPGIHFSSAMVGPPTQDDLKPSEDD